MGGAAGMSKNTNVRVKINKDGSLAIDLADESTRRQFVDAISPKNDDKIRSLQDKLRLLELQLHSIGPTQTKALLSVKVSTQTRR